MGKKKNNSRGFTLIAALLILVLLSGVAAGLLFMVTSESKMGGNDLEANLAYYGAESGMEKLTSDLAALYIQFQVPKNPQIQALTGFPPTSAMVNGMTYSETINVPLQPDGLTPMSSFNTVSSGSNQGLYAEIVPMTMQVIATRPSGATANITRKVEVALIPVFQFGVFCGYDCSYFPGPNFSFGGRVHTNQNLFLASGGTLVFNDKISAYSQIIADQLENGHPTSSGYGGTTYIPKANGGCPLNTFPPTGANCVVLPDAQASWSGGYPLVGTVNPFFAVQMASLDNGFVSNSTNGAKNMQLPFVQNSCTSNPPPCTDPISIIRKPQPLESAASTLGSSRLYNKAQIRILIADTQADLHPERGLIADGQDFQFPTSAATQYTLADGVTKEYFGWATPGANGWVNPFTNAGLQNWTGTGFPLIGELTSNPTSVLQMSSAATGGPWIRVEYYNNAGAWVGVTTEWLKLGFSRIFNNPPTAPASNMVDANAILIFQQLRPQMAQTTVAQAQASGHGAAGNFWPINLYDTREGEMRDQSVANVTSGTKTYSSCSVNGIMNAVELDVGNLAKWLNGSMGGGTTGANVNYTNFNGYVLYFSDHRGMLPSTNWSNGHQTPPGINGESGLEDSVNSSQNLTSTVQDGALDPLTYYTYSPEDVDQNGVLDNWGEKNIGYGFGINTAAPLNSYKRIPVTGQGTAASVDCASYDTGTGALLTGVTDQEGMANPVSGARHVLKLVDAGMSAAAVSYLPVMPPASACVQNAANPTGCGGFTIVSENPVYVQGNYNTSANDPFWGTANNPVPSQALHSAASIIADSVTVLSNTWSDMGSLMYPTTPANRAPAADAYYRMAVSGGKNIPFGSPGWANTAGINDFGTDGGMHNFLRYLENLGAITMHYDGSLVSMYYSEYNTGTFKCCATVYGAPTRNYFFDVLFLNPANLPPATPEFQDIVNLSYHQNFTPQ